MKYIIAILLSSLLSHHSQGQDSTITLSQFELFTSQPNKILKTESKEIGGFGWRDLYLFKTTDLASGASAYAIRIGNSSNTNTYVDPKFVYLDFNDLDPVINALTYFIAETERSIPKTDFLLTYITPNDIAFSCFYDMVFNSLHIDMGKIYKNLRTYVPGTINGFNKKRFTEFIELLKKAKTSTW